MATPLARGVIFIHSAPRALCPHLEWAVGRALGHAMSFDWAEQPVLSGSRRAEFYWEGPAGTGAALATASVPVTAPAPGRFSMTKGCPIASARRTPRKRA